MFMGSSAQNRSANPCPSSSFAEEHFRKPALSLASAHRELHDMAIPGFGEIAEQLRRSTVLIHSGGRGSGSGVICSSNGVLVTNAHVVRSTRPAELAIAIGNPMGFVGALATGVIHGVGPLRGLGSQNWVQAEVLLAPGNSGGPLADARGKIVGINTMVAGRLALAIPSNAVRDFLSAIPSDGRLGVTVHPAFIPSPVSRAKTFGLVVLEVEPKSPAGRASLLPGDILLGSEEQRFASPEDLARALKGSGPRLLLLEFLRGDYQRVRRVAVQLGEQLPRRSPVAA